MTTETKHTTGPWHVDYKNEGQFKNAIYDEDENLITEVHGTCDGCEIDAAFIVRAINSHDALVGSNTKARFVLSKMEPTMAIKMAIAALDKALAAAQVTK